MKPQIVALLGSPLAEGNTAKLLKKTVAGTEAAGCDVQGIHVPELELSACREHYFCKNNTTCQMEDDVTPMYPIFQGMDSLIIATPVMTMGIPGHLKSFMDRFQVFFCAKYVRKDRLVEKEKRKKRKTLLLSISGMNLSEILTESFSQQNPSVMLSTAGMMMNSSSGIWIIKRIWISFLN